MSRVSVIVPNFNHAPYLRQRLDSIYAQTYRDFEVILLDDASTDGSRNILESYATRPATRLLLNERNSGSPFLQWRKGLSLAAGPYVWIAESDDFADPDFLATLVPVLEADARIVLSYCRIALVDAAGSVQRSIGAWEDPQGRWNSDFDADGSAEIASRPVAATNIPNASAVVFRLDAARRVNPGFVRFRGAGDWFFWIELMRQGRIAYRARTLSSFRWHGGNVTARAQGRGQEYEELFRVLRHLFGLGIVPAVERRRVARTWIGQCLRQLPARDPGRGRALREAFYLAPLEMLRARLASRT